MAGEALNFIEQLLALDEIGQNIMVDGDFGKMQIARALYYHGKRHGKKYSYIKTPDGYLVTLTGSRSDYDDAKLLENYDQAQKSDSISDAKLSISEFIENAPDGTTHHYKGRYVKNIRIRKSKNYNYAYDFWDGSKWRWTSCSRDEFLKIKPL